MPPKRARVRFNDTVQYIQSSPPPQPVPAAASGTVWPATMHTQWYNPANGGPGGLNPPPAPRLPPIPLPPVSNAQQASGGALQGTNPNNHALPQAPAYRAPSNAPPANTNANALGLIFPPAPPPGSTQSPTQPSLSAGNLQGGTKRGGQRIHVSLHTLTSLSRVDHEG
ncbi:hypothetical protein GY45DRAFT_719267 [Cubamyces sp. BRFM 1775]|nr:hypothetical protein GY45DRAFT_719267 [Cubamyces sp. BRFM 1775]